MCIAKNLYVKASTMNHFFKKVCLLFVYSNLIWPYALLSKCIPCTHALFVPRSQALNSSREYAGLYTKVHRDTKENIYSCVWATPKYTHSFNGEHITNYFFGCHLSPSCIKDCPSPNSLKISGSAIAQRGSKDWFADYFGLPRDFKGELSFSPSIENFLVDFGWYIGLNEWAPGLFCSLHAPVVHTRWHLTMREWITQPGILNHPAGYLATTALARSDLGQSMSDFFAGDTTFGDMKEGLHYGTIANCGLKKRTGFGELVGKFGYVVFDENRSNDYHVSFALRGAVPTGTRPKARALFDPIVGNAHHWELGAELSGHITVWHSANEQSYGMLYGTAYATHLFSDKQLRSFDPCGKPMSRYALIEQMTPTISDELMINGATPRQQYARKLFPAINKTTLITDVDVPVQGAATICFVYVHKAVDMSVGYALWGRSGERYTINCSTAIFKDNTYALKGDAQLYGFLEQMPGNPTAIALNATQRNATINGGAHVPGAETNFSPITTALANNNADFKGLATGNGMVLNNVTSADATTEAPGNGLVGVSIVQVNGSQRPQLLTSDDLHTADGPAAVSHTLFAHISYTWDTKKPHWRPFIGIGVEGEFAQRIDHVYATTSQWGVWLKIGSSF